MQDLPFQSPDQPADAERPRPGAASAPRRTYQKPTVTFRQPIDQVAAVCPPPNGKANPIDCIIGSS